MKSFFSFFVFCTVLGFGVELHSETLDAYQIVQRVLDNYPSVYSAQFQVEKARKNMAKIDSQLGWQLKAGGGFTKDVTLLGGGVDIVDVNAGVQRLLGSGDSVSIHGSLRRDNADEATLFSPKSSISTDISMNYRKPLRKRAGNLAYVLDKQRAQLSLAISQAKLQELYDQLAENVIDLYLAAISTRERIENVKQSLKRTQRLQKFIKSRFSLGIAENKDQLQVAAQFHTQSAQLKALEVAWLQQKLALNRLMGVAWNNEFVLQSGIDDVDVDLFSDKKVKSYIEQAMEYNPLLNNILQELRLSEIEIKAARDERKDAMDLVMHLGNKKTFGDRDASLDSLNKSQFVGGIRLELNRSVDRSGHDAIILQAQLSRNVVLSNQKRATQDIQYEIAGLIAQMHSLNASLEAYKKSVNSERAKLNEADDRYRKGRIDVDRLIQFENQLSASELAYALQFVEMQRRVFRLSLLRGELWKEIRLPHHNVSISKDQEKPF